jgi:hypothetical protein
MITADLLFPTKLAGAPRLGFPFLREVASIGIYEPEHYVLSGPTTVEGAKERLLV